MTPDYELCPHHEAMQKDIRWLIKIGFGVFSVGLAVVVVGLYSIFYAGGLTERVSAIDKRVERIEQRVFWGNP